MPELPEVEVIRSGLEPLLKGAEVLDITAFRSALRYPLPNFSVLHGYQLECIKRRSKYLLFYFSMPSQSSIVLIWHLGMTGQFHVLRADAAAAKHEHVRFDFTNGKSLRYRDARRFGYAALVQANALEQHAWLKVLGVEPLSDAFTLEGLSKHCQGRKKPIKSLIMDAHVVVGVGNIYASEALFLAAIHPKRAAGRISNKRLHDLLVAIQATLKAAIQAGGSSISDFVQVDGKPGYFAHDFNVYGREGEACRRCSGTIRRMVQSGRSSFYCSGCQH